MVARSPESPVAADNFVLITRAFRAPRELVFAAWTSREHLLQWFAPPGCEISFRELDIRTGGSFHSCIHTPDGHDCWCRGDYLEVTPPERLVFTMAVANAAGDLISPTAAGMHPDWPRETTVTVTFAAQGNDTLVTLHQTVDEALAKQTGAYPSWLAMLDRLEELVGG